jgi:hypothetical protein
VAIQFKWRSAEKYAEHILAPRLAWLNSLGFVDIRQSRGTRYTISPTGFGFLKHCITLGQAFTHDISSKWLEEQGMKTASMFLASGRKFSPWETLPQSERVNYLTPFIERAFQRLDEERMGRVLFFPFATLVLVTMACSAQVIADRADLIESLQFQPRYGDKIYAVRLSARANESYVSSKDS